MIVRVVAVDQVTGDPAWLTATEQDRRDRLRREHDRDAYSAAHLLARLVAGELLDLAPGDLTLTQRCPDCAGTDHGRPAVDGHDVHVSLSHTDGVVAAIAAHTECGIDVERVGVVPPRALTPAELTWSEAQADVVRARTLLWTRKEALVKATGRSLADAIATDVVSGDFGEWHSPTHVASWTC